MQLLYRYSAVLASAIETHGDSINDIPGVEENGCADQLQAAVDGRVAAASLPGVTPGLLQSLPGVRLVTRASH
jgi:hypothetical protein